MNTYKPDKAGMGYQKKMAIVAGIIIAVLIVVGIFLDGFNGTYNNSSSGVPDGEQTSQNDSTSAGASEQASVIDTVDGMTIDGAIETIKAQDTEFSEPHAKSLKQGLEQWVNQSGISSIDTISVDDVQTSNNFNHIKLTINGIKVSCDNPDWAIWNIVGDNGVSVQLEYADDFYNYVDTTSDGTNTPNLTKTSAFGKIIGQDHANILVERFKQYCDAIGASPNDLYINVATDKNILDPLSKNGVVIRENQTYTATVHSTQDTTWQRQINFTLCQNSNDDELQVLDTSDPNGFWSSATGWASN